MAGISNQGRGRRIPPWVAVAVIALLTGLLFWLFRASAVNETAAKDAPPPLPPELARDEAHVPDAGKPIAARPRLERSRDAGAPLVLRNDAGMPQLFGPLVAMGQGMTLAELFGKNAANADKYVDKFCEETRKLRANEPAGKEPGTNRDAAEFMAPLIDYEKPLDQPPGKLHLSDAFRQRIYDYGDDWPARITDADLAGLDFSWMPALAPFDHWSLLGAGPVRERPVGNIFEDPIPNYLSLIYWTKLRFALALRKGDIAQAVADERHLSMLLRSQGLLLGIGVAVVIEKQEARIYAALSAAGADVSGFTPADPAQLQTYKQMEFASIYFTYPGVSEETLRKAVGCMVSPCMSLMEGAGANRAAGDYVDSDNLALINALSLEHGCDQRPFVRANNSKKLDPLEALSSLTDGLDNAIPSRF